MALHILIDEDGLGDPAIHKVIFQMNEVLKSMQLDLTALKAAVSRQTQVDKSILVLVQGLVVKQTDLSQQLKDAIAAGDPVALAQVQADLDAMTAELTSDADGIQQAVVDNTPAAPTPTP